jgi:hypothetical protein
MASEKLDPKDFADWLTPRAAVQMLEPEFGTDSHSYIAKNTLLERLRGSEIRAVAGTTEIYAIDASDWTHIDENNFLWTSGDVTFEWMSGSGYYLERHTTRHYHVRLDRAGVRALLPPTPHPRTVTVQRDDAETDANDDPVDQASKGPRVSDPALKAWYEVYRSVYSGSSEDTEENAMKSARGMFPGKSVARDRVRALRGEQKRGPKGPRNS